MTSQQANVLILRSAGTNCDRETAFAFQSCGASVELVHINKLLSGEVSLRNYHILAIPGGFTYGDDIASGRILANELRLHLGGAFKQFMADGKLAIGICNGFQILVKAGFLPGFSFTQNTPKDVVQDATLTYNDSGKFEDRWVHLKAEGSCVWTEGLKNLVYFPVAHAEGKFIPKDDETLRKLKENKQIIFRYCSSDGREPVYPECPNGSTDYIAGITDTTGRILGLMPHPERHFLFTQHPFWTRLEKNSDLGDGAKIFQNGVEYVKKHLLRG
ncbi:MAG: phosphoribosylformylglycinamidine synthase I [Candidatus Omnitrophica bacterium]|nr:phosphoribosylformylglycinamidine synthase I [Candidatus Omnitrophota bacterium]